MPDEGHEFGHSDIDTTQPGWNRLAKRREKRTGHWPHIVLLDDNAAVCDCGWSYEGLIPGTAAYEHSKTVGGATVERVR